MTVTRVVADDLTRDLTVSARRRSRFLRPFTGEVLHDLPISTVQDVQDAAAAARVAQAAWWAAGTPTAGGCC